MAAAEYPLVPGYRATGERHILLWYEYSIGHHLVVAESERALVSTWSTVLAKNGGAEPKSQYFGRVVLPPEWMSSAHASHAREQARRTFVSYAASLAQGYFVDRGRLPGVARPCPSADKVDTERASKAFGREFFPYVCAWDCSRCFGSGVALSEGSWEDLFEREGSEKFASPRCPSPFDGERAPEDARLLAFVLNAGHHLSGSTAEVVDSNAARRSWSDLQLLLLGASVPIDPRILAEVAAVRERQREVEARRSAEFEERKRAREAAQIADAEKIFGVGRKYYVHYSVAKFGEQKAGPYSSKAEANEHLVDIVGFEGVTAAHVVELLADGGSDNG